MRELRDLAGFTALVTGGASGIGLETVKKLVERGAAITVVDADPLGEARLDDAGLNVHFVCGDVVDRAIIEQAAALAAMDGRIDLVFGNAGKPSASGVLEVSDRDWQATLDVNLTALRTLVQTTVPYLRSSEHPSVVFTASAAGLVAMGAQTAYASAKGAVIAFGRAVAAEFASDGIRVNCVCPGWVDTPMLKRFYEGLLEDPEERAAAVASAERDLPLGRFAQPNEIAAVATFLLSPESSYITGAALAVDGGLTVIR